MKLYPLIFTPIFKETIWGSYKVSEKFKTRSKEHDDKKIGELWIMTDNERKSMVSNGALKGMSINELMKEYYNEIFGNVKEKYEEFPLLIKLITTSDILSLQVHPDDEKAKEYENSNGKYEAWYIISGEENSEIVVGFNKKVNKKNYKEILKGETENLEKYLNAIMPKEGDMIEIDHGLIHAIGKGVDLLEVQQNSDITYRVYDYNRTDKDGNKRELHLEKAIDVIDVKKKPKFRKKKINSKYFKMNELVLKHDNKVKVKHDFPVMYVPLTSDLYISCNSIIEHVPKYCVVLVPAEAGFHEIMADGKVMRIEL